MAPRKKGQTKTTPTSFKLGKVCSKRDRETQPRIETYFQKEQPISKKKKSKPKKFLNFQGYSLEKCRFRKCIGKSCYTPWGYGKPRPIGYVEGAGFCTSCLLEPCFLYERNEEIEQASKDLLLHNQTTDGDFIYLDMQGVNDAMNPQMKEVMKGHLEDIFSVKYVKKFGLPNCAKFVVDREFPPSVKSPAKKMTSEPLFPPVGADV